MGIIYGSVHLDRLFEIDTVTAESFSGAASSRDNVMTITGMRPLSDVPAKTGAVMMDKNGNNVFNVGDELRVTLPGEGEDSVLARINTAAIDRAGSGFGGGRSYSLFRDEETGRCFFYAEKDFDISRIEDGRLELTERGDAPSAMKVDDIICFGAGTMVRVPGGQCRVSDLRVGDQVTLMEGEALPVRWISRTRVQCRDKLFPVRIEAGALGAGLPGRRLFLSRQHRLLVASRIAERITGLAQVLVPAIRLVGLPGISIDETPTQMDYVHLLLARHALLLAEGAPAESLLMAEHSLSVLARTGDAPGDWSAQGKVTPARPVPSVAEQKAIVARHAKHGRSLLELWAPAPLCPA